jgi:hypothetical protein
VGAYWLDRRRRRRSRAGNSHQRSGVDPIVSALVYVAARAPDAGEDYAALAANFPPANAGLVKSGGFAQLSEEAFLKDFAGVVDFLHPALSLVSVGPQGHADHPARDPCALEGAANGAAAAA